MRKIIICILVASLFAISVSATDFALPGPPQEAEKYMPEDTESFSDGLKHILKEAIRSLHPDFAEASRICLAAIACVLLMSLIKTFSWATAAVDLTGVLIISLLLVDATDSMIHLGSDTIQQISEYGKLMLPVLTGALASEGGAVTAAALYTGTVFFNTFLLTAIEKFVVPLLYVYMALCIAHRAIGEDLLKNLCDFLKWISTWAIKIVIYVFTGYLGITGVISGTTDAAALKAAKLTISGAVPVVGSIISDASETVLVSAGAVKNSIGIYGLLAICAIGIAPFLRIGIQYLLLKLTYAVCGIFGAKGSVSLLGDFSGIMGLMVAATSTVCLLLFVSIVCYLKGVG